MYNVNANIFYVDFCQNNEMSVGCDGNLKSKLKVQWLIFGLQYKGVLMGS